MGATGNAEKWVNEVAGITRPASIEWCDGTGREYARLVGEMMADGTLIPLNERTYPECFLHRSHPSDVARTEQLTFICTGEREAAGPTNNWMAPAEGRERVGALLRGSMSGRRMFAVPYLMGPAGSPYSRVGLMVTDSAYVVASMHIMTRVGLVALDSMRHDDDFVGGIHSLGDLSPDRRFILHFPEERRIWSVGSGYGGNALLGKKCHALRIASWDGRQEGWMAEHMLILGVEDPEGEITYLAAAMPSASGKTNLAMVVSALPGYRVWTVGDDIAWIHRDVEGRFRAINPERGFFGVAPNTSAGTNPGALAMIRSRTIFTNVALTSSREPWWEGIGTEPGPGLRDWQGRPWAAGSGPAAHPNSRFTAPAAQCPSISPHWQDPEGVPISGFIFGSRRSQVVPLVYEAFDWQHGVYAGSSMTTETTAAITGQVGVVRLDPMAMLPFCGYNMADYFGHWLRQSRGVTPPRIFRVNWFRRDGDGRFLWPGYGDNVRILKWMVDRIRGRASAVETPIGLVPATSALDLEGLAVSRGQVEAALAVDRPGWIESLAAQRAFFDRFGSRLPGEILAEHERAGRRLATGGRPLSEFART